MLGPRINELRTAFGWNQVQLAQKLTISKQTVSNWENNNILPSVDMLMKISQFLGSLSEQSASLPGRAEIEERADFLVVSLALRAASLALDAMRAFSIIIFPT